MLGHTLDSYVAHMSQNRLRAKPAKGLRNMSFINVKVSKTTMAGVVGLAAAGMAATIVLANDTAADTTDFRAVEERQSAPAAYNYTGVRTADAVEAWLKAKTAYTGPKTADAAEAWFESGTEYTGPRTADAAEHWIAALRDD